MITIKITIKIYKVCKGGRFFPSVLYAVAIIGLTVPTFHRTAENNIFSSTQLFFCSELARLLQIN